VYSRIINIITKTHQWLGLGSGLLVFLISISGVIYTFKDEIFNAVHAESMHVKKPGNERLPLDSLWNIAQAELGTEYPITTVNAYKEPDKTWRFKAYKYNDETVSYFSWCEYDYILFVNPYTGEIKKTMNHKYEFFQLVKMFHWSFLLRTEIGQPIVGWTVFLFVICLITGIIWWWPRRNKFTKRSFTIRWRGVSLDINRDLHVVTGIYSIPLLLVLAFTGMVWSFKWFMALVYVVANLSTQPPATPTPPESATNKPIKTIYETVYQNSRAHHPEAYDIALYALEEDKNTVDTYVKNKAGVYYDASLETYDASTGKRLTDRSFENMNRGEKLIAMNYDIHTGAVLGIWGKILAFIGGLIAAGLPLTGFIIWWLRQKEKNKFLKQMEI